MIDVVRAMLLAALVMVSAGCVRMSTPLTADRTPSQDVDASTLDAPGRDVAVADTLRPDRAPRDEARIDLAPPSCTALLDSSFGTAGLAFLAAPGVSAGAGVAVAPGGKILVGGRTATDLALARFDAAGNVDASFGKGGLALASWSGGPQSACNGLYLLGVQASGRPVLIGGSGVYSEISVLTRLTVAGALDTSFGSGGFQSSIWIWTAGLVGDQPVVGGPCDTFPCTQPSSPYDYTFQRYSADGSLDKSFGPDGRVIVDIGGSSYDVPTAFAAQPDGKLLLAGSTSSCSSGDNDHVGLARVTAAGALDGSFNKGGTLCLPEIAGYHDQQVRLVVQPDGRIVLITTDSAWQLVIARLSSDGSYDAWFGKSGRTITALPASPAYPLAVLVLPSGKLLALIEAGAGAVLARYLGTGSLDTTFGTGGLYSISVGKGASTAARLGGLALQPDGRVLVGGYAASVGGAEGVFVLRLCPG